MRGEQDQVLYVGKAKNLRKRLGSYRVANPDRVQRRHLRLLRAVRRIELEPCADEAAALAREGELLRALRPKFNRAGTWRGPQRFLAWRVCAEDQGLEFEMAEELPAGWHGYAGVGGGAVPLRACLMRLVFCAMNPERGWAGLPVGWTEAVPSGARVGMAGTIRTESDRTLTEGACGALKRFFQGDGPAFEQWIRSRCGSSGVFETAAIEAELELLRQWGVKIQVIDTPTAV